MFVVATALIAIAEVAIAFATLDPRWRVALVTPPSAGAGFDATTAFVPLRGGEIVAVDLDRGTIRWRAGVATTFTPATGEGLVFAATSDTIEARDATTADVKWRTPLAGGAAAPLYWLFGWLIASTQNG